MKQIHYITKSFVLFVALWGATAVWAQPAAKQNGEEAEYLLMRREYRLNEDATMDIRIRKELRLLRNSAMMAYATNGESFIEYNPAFEQLTINECYTEQVDGTRVVPRERAYVEQLPSSCSDCGRRNGIREMAIVHTGLEVGCTIVLDYTIHRNSVLLLDRFDLLQAYPVRHYEVIYDGDTVIDVVHLPRNLWRETPYISQPKETFVEVAYGTLPAWETECQLPAAKVWVDTLSRRSSMERVEYINRWVRQNIVCHHGLDLSHIDYRLSPAAVVYADGCGTPAECVALTAALLGQAGIDATLYIDTTVFDLAESFRLEVVFDGVHYRYNPLSDSPMVPVGLAVDELGELTVDSAYAVELQPVNGNYGYVTLPEVEGALDIDPSSLLPSRTLPVEMTPCVERYHYTITLPRNAKLADDAIKVQRKVKGVGSVAISVKQKGRKLQIDRELKIETSRVEMDQYAEFRQMMQDWQLGKKLLVRL